MSHFAHSIFKFNSLQNSLVRTRKICIHSSWSDIQQEDLGTERDLIKRTKHDFKELYKKRSYSLFSILHIKFSSCRDRKTFGCVQWSRLHVGLGDDWVSEHAVLLQRQVVCATTSSFVGAGHDPQPALLTLRRGGKPIRNYFDHQFIVGLIIFSEQKQNISWPSSFFIVMIYLFFCFFLAYETAS